MRSWPSKAMLAILLGTTSLIAFGCLQKSSANSDPVTPVAPSVMAQPSNVTVNSGQPATFSVAAAGTSPLTYQWQRGSSAIPGATSSSYTTSATTAADNGATFRVIVSNSVGSIPSNAATLTVNVPPSITAQPASQTVTAGQTATFSVIATGSAPLTYQWQRGSTPILGATSPSYTTPVTTSADNGATFQVVVTDAAGNTPSAPATLTVNPAPVAPSITSQPSSQTVVAGQTATFSVAAAGTSPLTYQWQRGATPIAGATSSSYTTSATTSADSGATFQVVVTNSAGSMASAIATLTVNTPPSISSQPANQSVNVGQTATFSVAAAGTSPLTYQWQRGVSVIPGATSPSYTTPATTAADNGATFQVVVTNAAGNISSNIGTLTVNVPPSITSQPANQTVTSGQSATFSVTAAGTAPLTYQWQRGTTAIPGATSATYVTPPTTPTDNGAAFQVVVTNPAGNISSSAAMLTVNVPPSITSQPANRTVIAGQTATFSVTAAGTAPLAYQWQRGTTPIPGATSSSYTTPVTSAADNGATFQVVVTNPAGSISSASATLTVNVPPSITSPPANQTVIVGQTATFSVIAAGTAPLTYQWQEGTTPIPGAISASYTTPVTASTDNGETFQVVVSNSAGSISSTAATLTVNVPPSITSQPANQTVVVGQTATFSVVAAGTAPLTYQWQEGAAPIPGATSANYTTSIATSTDNNETFQVVVTNSAGNISSAAATLTVNVPPSITTQPSNQTVTVGQTATFGVIATGSPTPTYQWQKGSAPIAGATSSSYTTPATTSGDNGDTFQVVVTNAAGSITSNTATLTVNPASGPLSVSITSPASGGSVSGTIQVTATVSDGVSTVTGVQFQVDGLNLGAPVTSAPYSVSLDTTAVANSTHALSAIAADAASNQATSTVSTTVSNTLTGIPPGPLRVSTVNPRYFTSDGSHAVLLAGDHTWANLQDEGTPAPAVFDYNGYMSFMNSHGYNIMHLWTWWLPNSGTFSEAPYAFNAAPFPWVRTGPGTADDGGPQFDFTQLDFNYFSRMRQRIIQAGQNGIYVSIYLFNGFEFQYDVNPVDGNPFVITNNVNGVNCPNTCPTDNSLITPQAWAFEQQYLTQVINTVKDLDNVMYAVSNESPSPGSDTWQASIISFVKGYEASLPKQHPVGMVYQFSGGIDQTLYNSAADWVSPAFGGGGLNVTPDATGQCPTQTGSSGTLNPNSPNCKVVVNDTDHDCGICGDQQWAWQTFMRGNSLLFMDQYLIYAPPAQFPGYNNIPGGPCTNNQCTTVDPQWDPVRNAMADILVYANSKIDLVNMTPQDSLSTAEFCLANPGSQYLVYYPGSPSGNFILTTVPGTYTYEWFNPSTHMVVATGSITVTTNQVFTPPFSGDAVLWLHQ